MTEIIKKKFQKYGYKLKEDNSVLYFSNENIVFKLIKQRFNEIEVYFSNSSNNNIKLDFTLEVFKNNLRIEYLIKDGFGDRTENQILEYYNKLIFDIGLFLVLNQKSEIETFIEWHKKKSEEVYKDYLDKLREMS